MYSETYAINNAPPQQPSALVLKLLYYACQQDFCSLLILKPAINLSNTLFDMTYITYNIFTKSVGILLATGTVTAFSTLKKHSDRHNVLIYMS